jgi:ribosome maturation protein SDO1
MVKLEEAVIGRFDSKGEKFEILVDPELAMQLKKGQQVSFSDLLAVETVFKDSAKGTEQSPEALSKAFGTTEIQKIAEKIIKQGEVQLTTEQRRKMRETRVKEVIEFISRNAMNPQTNAPHPPSRIENAFNESKAKIDEMKDAEEQIQGILKELKKIIPISLEQIRIAVKIPAAHAGKSEHILHKYQLVKEEWQKDGSLIAVVEMPAGLKQDFLADLNSCCHGDLETKILEK